MLLIVVGIHPEGAGLLTNVPSSTELNAISLRLYFDAWERTIILIRDFVETFDIGVGEIGGEHLFQDEWNDYIAHAQQEMGAISVTIQHSAELCLKSLICDASSYLLLLNGQVPFNAGQQSELDFSELRTLDAVDLPDAVRTLTAFDLPDAFVEHYGDLRRLRNKITHLGSHEGGLTPFQIIKILGRQYISLWPDGRWLKRRVQFDGSSTRKFFHDERWSSVESHVMEELPYTLNLLGNAEFKKSFGTTKGQLKGYCPDCMSKRASKWDADGHVTAYRTGPASAKCAMCEAMLPVFIVKDACESCGCKTIVDSEFSDPLCFSCGWGH